MTRTYKFTCGIGLCGCNREEEIEIEFGDDEDEETIEEQVQEEYQIWRSNFLDGSWLLVEESPKPKKPRAKN